MRRRGRERKGLEKGEEWRGRGIEKDLLKEVFLPKIIFTVEKRKGENDALIFFTR